jgi:hypothetical protein
MRETCRLSAAVLADPDRQRELLVNRSDRDPWAVDEVSESVEDLDMAQDDEPEVGLVFRSTAEANAHLRLMAAINACPRSVDFTSAAVLELPEWPAVIDAASELLHEMSVDDDPPPLPSVDRISAVIDAVLRGHVSAEAASNWASRWTSRQSSELSSPDRRSALWRLVRATHPGRPDAPAAGWIDDVVHGRIDAGWLASAALNRGYLRNEINAYSSDLRPSEPDQSPVVNIQFWEDYGFSPPTTSSEIEITIDTLRSRLRTSGMDDDQAQAITFILEDVSPGWRMPRPPTPDGYRRRVWPVD